MNVRDFAKLGTTILFLTVVLSAVGLAQTTFYVNNQIGLDGYNGLFQNVTGNPGEGPKLTIANAIAAASNGDIISVANTGVAYGNLNTAGKTLTFASSAGTPEVANITVDAATSFTGPYALSGTGTLALTTGAVTNANNLTINTGGTITRAAGSLDVAPAFPGTANLSYSGANKTIGPEFPTASTVLNNLTVTGALTVTVNIAAQMSGTLVVDNAGGVLALGSNTLTITNTTALKNHNITGSVTASASGGIVVSTTTGNVNFINAGSLPGLTTSGTTGIVDVAGPIAIAGSVTVNSGSVNLTSPTGATGLTGSLTNNGTGTVTVVATLTIGGNVANNSTGLINFGVANVTISGNVSNTGAQSNTSNTAQTANKGNINFSVAGDAVITIGGSVTNSTSFAGTTNSTATANAGGFLNSGNITFASTASAVSITGLVTNSSASTFTLTGAAPDASVLSGNGRITFANTTGNVTFTGGVTNSSSGFTFAGTAGNGTILFSARASGTVTVGTGAANADLTNSSSNTGGTNGNVDLTAAATGALTVNGNVTLASGAATGDIILGAGTGTVSGSVSNARSTSTAGAAQIQFNATGNNSTVGSLSSSGNGTIAFSSTTGGITVSTGGSINLSSGTISTASSSGAITINGNYTQSGGSFTAASLTTGAVSVTGNLTLSTGTLDLTASGVSNVTISGNLSFTGGTLNLGAGARNFTITGALATLASGITIGGGAGTTMIFNRAVSAQTLTSGIGVTWPGHLNINNTFPAAPTFSLAGANIIVTGNVTFSAGGAADGVSLSDFHIFVGGNFVNNSGYTAGPNGFVSMQGGGAQVITGTANFFNIEVDNAAGATFGTGTGVVFTITGTVLLTNGTVSEGGGGDDISLNNATTPPTIVRNQGGFASAPTFTSDVSVTYIGASKVFSNEVPAGGTNKLVNLTIATTGISTVTANIDFEFKGTLTINSGQTFAIGAQVVTANGASIVTNGSWTSTTGKVVLNRGAGTALTGSGALPQIDVANASSGNTINGSTGITVGTTPDLTLLGGGASGVITVTFTGAGPHIAGNVTTNGANNVLTLGSSVIVTGNVVHNGGSIVLATFNLSVRGATPSITAGAAITGGTGKFIFNRTGAQTFTVNTGAATIAANVEVNLDAAGTVLTVQTNNLTISGDLTLTRGTLTLSSNLTLTGTALTLTANGSVAGAGVLTFAPASSTTLTVTLAGATTFNNLTINGNVTLSGASGTLTVTTTLTHTSGLLDFGARDIVVATFTRTGGTYAATTGFLEVTTAFTQGTGFSIPNLATNGTFTVGSAQNFTVSSTYHLKSGTFTHENPVGTPRMNIPGSTVRVTSGTLDVAPVYGGAIDLNYTLNADRTAGVEWPAAQTVNTLWLNCATTATNLSFPTGTRTVSGTLNLTQGLLNLGANNRTLNLADSVTINRTGNAQVDLTDAGNIGGAGAGAGSGTLAFIGISDVNYVGTVAIGSTGAELSTSGTALRNLTFTRTGDVANFTTTNGRTITVNGALNIRNNLTTNNTITTLGDVNISTDAGNNPTTPVTTFNQALNFAGSANQNINVPSAGISVGAITVNKTGASNTVTLAGGNLTVTGTGVTFVNGIFVTGSNVLILPAPAAPNQGFDRSGVTGANISHVVGNVRKALQNTGNAVTSTNIRSEFPVGTADLYRPVALTFPLNQFGTPTIPTSSITVSHQDVTPGGTAGLPIVDGVSPGVDVTRYPIFYWFISSNVSLGSVSFNLELQAAGFTGFGTIGDVRMIRRFEGNINNPWILQGTSYDNLVDPNGDPIVTNINSTGGINQTGARFTYGLRALLAPGDTDGDGTITAFDASLILQHVVGLIVLDPDAQSAADVDGDGQITAFDASLVLQFVVGLRTCFPVEVGCTGKVEAAIGTLGWERDQPGADGKLALPVTLSKDARHVTSAQFKVQTDPTLIKVEGVKADLPKGWVMFYKVHDNGELRVAMAGAEPISGGKLATIELKLLDAEKAAKLTATGFINANTEASFGELSVRQIPTEYALQQNYPNPFNPTTTIKYQLAEDSNIQLAIYNVMGQKVRTLVNGDQQQAGFYTIQWNGLDDSGAQVASGLYLYRIQAKNFTAIKKMLFVK